MKKIRAVILDGFHKGHVVNMEYMPTVKLLKPRSIQVDEYDDEPSSVISAYPEQIEYKECFRGVDQDVVLYSEKGKSGDFLSWFNRAVGSQEPWNEYTTLYFGYHRDPIYRKQDGTQLTEYDRGFERGIEEGRILQAKEMRM